MAKKFFLVCGGILMLGIAYTLGANTVVAQGREQNVVGIAVYGNDAIAVTDEGDVYQATNNEKDNWVFRVNIFRVAKSK